MPHAKTHNDRKVKNYLIFGLLLLFVVFIFSITIVKIHNLGEVKKSEVISNEEK